MRLGEKIKKLRKRSGFSQGELAKKVDITATHLSRLEKGRYQPSVVVAKKLANELQVSVDYLLSEIDEEIKEVRIEDQAFLERIQLLNSLDGRDREVVIHIIDSLLTKRKILNLLTEKEELVTK